MFQPATKCRILKEHPLPKVPQTLLPTLLRTELTLLFQILIPTGIHKISRCPLRFTTLSSALLLEEQHQLCQSSATSKLHRTWQMVQPKANARRNLMCKYRRVHSLAEFTTAGQDKLELPQEVDFHGVLYLVSANQHIPK